MKINIITAPDKLLNKSKSFFLIHPREEITLQLQNFLQNYQEKQCNVYMYMPENEDEEDIKWVLDICHIADYIVIDIDNCSTSIRNFLSYMISLPNVFYLTNDEVTPYNYISVNRIFNLDWLTEREV